jgi:alpha-glucosidase (family GH31 glycosyl hydrolase)
MMTKMSLIRYYSTELVSVTLEGGAFIKPLFFEFADDLNALTESQELNIMLGPALKLSINSNTLN